MQDCLSIRREGKSNGNLFRRMNAAFPDICWLHASSTFDHVKMRSAGGEGHVDPDAAVASLLINEGERWPRALVPAPDIAHGVVLVNLVPYPANIAPDSQKL